jgi:hypothetical protein
MSLHASRTAVFGTLTSQSMDRLSNPEPIEPPRSAGLAMLVVALAAYHVWLFVELSSTFYLFHAASCFALAPTLYFSAFDLRKSLKASAEAIGKSKPPGWAIVSGACGFLLLIASAAWRWLG